MLAERRVWVQRRRAGVTAPAGSLEGAGEGSFKERAGKMGFSQTRTGGAGAAEGTLCRADRLGVKSALRGRGLVLLFTVSSGQCLVLRMPSVCWELEWAS